MSLLLEKKKIALHDKIGYGVGNMTYGLVFQMIGTYIVFYATAVLGIPGGIIGTAVSISVFWDAVSDPFMGYISDITKSAYFGRRHGYVLLGTVSMALSNYFLWSIDPEWSSLSKYIVVFICLFLVRTSLTVFITPYTALGAELTSDYNERTSIQGIRMMFFVLGLMTATLMGFFLFFDSTPEFPVGQLNPSAYSNMGFTASVVALVLGLLCYFVTRKYIPFLPDYTESNKRGKSPVKIFSSFRTALENTPYKHVVFAYLFTNIASAFVGTLGIHVFTYTFGIDNTGIGILFGTLFTVSIISQPIWIKISAVIDKKPAALLGISLSIFGSLVFLAAVFARDIMGGEMIYLVPFAAITGFGTGALFTLPFSMIADTIDLDELKTGRRMEGVYYGTMTLFYKFSQSIAIFFLGILLDIVNFDSSLETQPESTVLILGLTVALGSIIVLGIAGYHYYKYSLDRAGVSRIQRDIVKEEEL